MLTVCPKIDDLIMKVVSEQDTSVELLLGLEVTTIASCAAEMQYFTSSEGTSASVLDYLL